MHDFDDIRAEDMAHEGMPESEQDEFGPFGGMILYKRGHRPE